MRRLAESLDASKASDAISGEVLGWVLARRIASLQDDPRTTLFFGRIDVDPADGPAEQFHIGRRHVSDEAGDPVVVDWRAPISTAFYRASPLEPMDVVLRRRFGVDRGRLTAFEDEHLREPAQPDGSAGSILAAEIERPRTGPMRDIVSTIQPEQDEIVRSDVAVSVCVQGAPGTGKTAVGLHRAAWLLYSFRERLDRSGVLVVGPNRAFLDHIGAVLPSLGEVRVGHATIESLLDHGAVRAEEPVAVATLKGDARLATVLRRAVWSRLERPDGGARGAARRAQVARAGIRGGRDRRRAGRPRGALLRRTRPAPPAARAPRPPRDGAGRRRPGRPRSGRRREVRSREEVRRVGVAGARRAIGAAPAVVRRRRPEDRRR